MLGCYDLGSIKPIVPDRECEGISFILRRVSAGIRRQNPTPMMPVTSIEWPDVSSRV